MMEAGISSGKEGAGHPVLLVTKEFVFDAAHQLPDYDGKCERLHGHTWKLHVTVRSPVDPRSGIAFDFVMLKKIVMERVIDVLDHSFVNDFLEHPSAENICLFVWEKCRDLPLYEVKVWETPTSFATYRPGL
jgi:6-pyruvoyltetrahydropterin/6-carboxytetrahydropterin synthase